MFTQEQYITDSQILFCISKILNSTISEQYAGNPTQSGLHRTINNANSLKV